MYEKYLRNIELADVEERYRERSSIFSCGMPLAAPPQYPLRPPGKYPLVSIGGFKRHPNESQYM